MIKDYLKGQYEEDVEFEINDSGTDAFTIRLFGDILNYAVSDIALYSDSGRTTPLSGADWEIYLEDDETTANEVGESGKTVVSMIRLLNATYQTGAVYGKCTNFGPYTSGGSQGVSYITLTDSSFTTNNYDFTIEPNIKETIIDCSAVTASSQQITMVRGTHPCGDAGPANMVKVIGSSTVQIDITYSGSSLDYWHEPTTILDFYFSGSTLKQGKGLELMWALTDGATSYPINPVTDTTNGKGWTPAGGEIYWIGGLTSANLDVSHFTPLRIGFLTDEQYSGEVAGTHRFSYNGSTPGFNRTNSAIRIEKIWREV